MGDDTRTFQMSGLYVSVLRELAYRDDEGTLVAYFPDTDFANLRCSTISITKNGSEVLDAGPDTVREKAESSGVRVEKDGEKFLCSFVEPSSEDDRDEVQYWYVGIGGNVAIISLSVSHDYRDDPRAGRMREAAHSLVSSIRRAD